MLMEMAFLLSTLVKSVLVKWLPWSVLKICGQPLFCQSLPDGVDTERSLKRVRQPPRQNAAREPVIHRCQIDEAAI
jgi:hypothetical protein